MEFSPPRTPIPRISRHRGPPSVQLGIIVSSLSRTERKTWCLGVTFPLAFSLFRSSKTAVGKVFNISQKHPIGTVKLGETGSGVRDMAWLHAQVEYT